MTQMCCDTTARQAMHRGLNVEFLSDATGTFDISMQEKLVQKSFIKPYQLAGYDVQ